jgi:pilus assembly protein Flp/PilA
VAAKIGSKATGFATSRAHCNSHCGPDSLTVRNEMRATLRRLWAEEEGQDLVEYALVVALIGLASVAAMNNVAGLLDNAFTNAVANMSSTTT